MCFQLVGLTTPSVPTLCLKDSQMKDDTIYPELLTVEVLATEKQEKLYINND